MRAVALALALGGLTCTQPAATPVQADAGLPSALRDAGGTELVRLEADVDAIFRASCATCHPWSARTVVNAPTTCGGPGSVLVAPWDLSASRLFGKVAHTPACGAAMPPQGGLSFAAVETLREWIVRGAPLGGHPSTRRQVTLQPASDDLQWMSGD